MIGIIGEKLLLMTLITFGIALVFMFFGLILVAIDMLI